MSHRRYRGWEGGQSWSFCWDIDGFSGSVGPRKNRQERNWKWHDGERKQMGHEVELKMPDIICIYLYIINNK